MPKIRRTSRTAYAILIGMKGDFKARGFTIVETLVVLGVSAALFVSVAATLSGRQNRTQFSQSVQDIKSQIQQVIHDVGSGYYPNPDNFSCSATSTGLSLTDVVIKEQGENKGCIFLGKALQFGVHGMSNTEEFRIFTIAGLQKPDPTSDLEVRSYAEAKPVVIAPGTSPSYINVPDASITGKRLYGLTVRNASYGATNIPIVAVAFVSSLASYDGASIISGSQSVNVVPIANTPPNVDPNVDPKVAAEKINERLIASDADDPAIRNPSTGVKICFVSGTTGQSGLITIGSSNRQLSVTLDIKDNITCA